MHDYLRDLLHPAFILVLSVCVVPVLVWGTTTIVSTIAKTYARARVAESEIALKREMIAQGRTVEEIERVLRASAHLWPKDKA